ncbi:SDR family oxidoreductase [Paenibacillus glycinis]|uniref:SDR family oxidoreductase n=1 Tax=Paenibacillus glycinis TaxID=2697035 RepID=A0ABW9XYX7_9BACL|nr:SDR family oxidoreductase [Paenibacillus glycinis]NBD27939.1 SDR family oxidoreductase [Paenibacillus glycinis]
MGKLKKKIALVTGASRGIGRGIALALAREGAMVAVHYGTRRQEAEEVVRAIESGGGEAFAIGADLAASGGITELYAALDDALQRLTGAKQLDILVNNAGIGQYATIRETTEESFDDVMGIYVKAPVFVIQQALPRLRDGGRIINISSAATRIAFPNLFGYSISKGAINTLTFVLAQELGARGITVNAILPGLINTDMNADTLSDPEGRRFASGLSAFGRWGEPEDVADIALFLASEASRWITGQLIDASGGSRL